VATAKKELKISKLDAARRQLETVIRLYFGDGDPVSIHTLTAAAYNVIHDVSAKRGATPMLVKDLIVNYVRPEYKRTFLGKINEAENFFKHADRDSETTLDFNPDMSEMLIVDASMQYHQLTGELPPLFRIYQTWFLAQYQDVFNFPEELKRTLHTSAALIRGMGRAQYLATMLPLVMPITA
jgi:hypothetical protein